MSISEYEDIAEKITKAFAARSTDMFARLYAEDIVVWHNNDQIAQDKLQNIETLGMFFESFVELEYTQIKRNFLSDGFVQQHIVSGQRADGARLEMPACLIVRIRDGTVCRIDEYLDPAPFYEAVGIGAS